MWVLLLLSILASVGVDAGRPKPPVCTPKPVKPKCGPNEVPSNCKIVCPPQSCESIYTTYMCEKLPCEKGCNCINGYLRNANGTCIPNEQCFSDPDPVCGPNEEPSDCKIVCPPQSCASIYSSYLCDKDRPCEKGCNCINGYLRNSEGTCIPSEQCSIGSTTPECGTNEVYSDCKIVCPPQSCESIYTDYLCLNGGCEPGCNCIDNYLRDTNGTCIPSDQCPTHNWNGCSVNETYVDCAFRCPNQYCPEDDSRLQVACKPGRPCPPGCACNPGYKRKSTDDESCILASDCPPVSCTRPNEVWAPCASDCLNEKCEDIDNPPPCEPTPDNCQPQCVCKKNFCRNDKDICVPSGKCIVPKPPIYDRCTATCAVPNPSNCSSGPVNKCESGYILSKQGGKCIKIEDCPQNLGCNGDPNAVIKTCPSPCPSTCEQPNSLPCKRLCLAFGCQCAPGYILSEIDGKCILPEKCKCGNPCGENERFVSCYSGCPTDYCPVDDSRAIVICESYPFSPCQSGCVCNLNHKKLSREDDRCIVSSDCPPVNCTRPNEEWSPCPSDCSGEYCDSAYEEPVVCNTLVLNCQPRCTCIKNHFRNATDICVPAHECPKKETSPASSNIQN